MADKPVIDMRIYTIRPRGMPEYLKLFEELALPIAVKHFGPNSVLARRSSVISSSSDTVIFYSVPPCRMIPPSASRSTLYRRHSNDRNGSNFPVPG